MATLRTAVQTTAQSVLHVSGELLKVQTSLLSTVLHFNSCTT